MAEYQGLQERGEVPLPKSATTVGEQVFARDQARAWLAAKVELSLGKISLFGYVVCFPMSPMNFLHALPDRTLLWRGSTRNKFHATADDDGLSHAQSRGRSWCICSRVSKDGEFQGLLWKWRSPGGQTF